MHHTCGILVRVLVGRVILDLGRVKDDNVCKVARGKLAPIADPQVPSRQRRQFTDSFFYGNNPFFADVASEKPRKIAIRTRMG